MRLVGNLVIFCVLLTSALSQNIKQILIQRYTAVTSALQQRNMGGIEAILAPDYRAIAKSGKTAGRDKILKQFDFQAKSMTNLTWPRTIQTLKLEKGLAIATVSGHLSAYTRHKPARHLELIATTKDTWKKDLKGTWLLESSQLIESKMLLDGKPFSGARH